MHILKSVRITPDGQDDQGKFGTIITPRGQVFDTGELPWRNNIPDKSCIPTGIYPVKWLWSPHHNRNVYHVMGVPGRDKNGQLANVEIHSGSYCGDVDKGFRSDVLGCMLLGKGLATGKVGDAGEIEQRIIINSKTSVSKFEGEMNCEDFMLEVTTAYETGA